jgi:hypothetical protein
MEKTREALEAAYHIAECGEHPDHLLAAENAARAALAEVEEWEARMLNLEVQGISDALGFRDTELEEAKAERDRLRTIECAARYVVDMHPDDEPGVDRKSMRRLRDAVARAALGEQA